MRNVPGQGKQGGVSEALLEQTGSIQPGRETDTVSRRNPQRNRRKLVHLQEFETEDVVDIRGLLL